MCCIFWQENVWCSEHLLFKICFSLVLPLFHIKMMWKWKNDFKICENEQTTVKDSKLEFGCLMTKYQMHWLTIILSTPRKVPNGTQNNNYHTLITYCWSNNIISINSWIDHSEYSWIDWKINGKNETKAQKPKRKFFLLTGIWTVVPWNQKPVCYKWGKLIGYLLLSNENAATQ